MLLPSFSSGTPQIDNSVYDYMKKLWEEELENDDPSSYRYMAFSKGEGDK